MAVEGVVSASVVLDTKEAKVVYDPAKAGKDDFAKALKEKDLEAVFEA